jgi:hypothetical protein
MRKPVLLCIYVHRERESQHSKDYFPLMMGLNPSKSVHKYFTVTIFSEKHFASIFSVELLSIFIHSLMPLQPSVGLWPLLLFRNHFYTDGRTPWTGDQPVARPLPAHTINSYTDIHASSGIRTHDPSVRAGGDVSCLRPRGHCDRPTTYRGK